MKSFETIIVNTQLLNIRGYVCLLFFLLYLLNE